MAKYEEKDYGDLIGINGLSEKLLKNHFVLYQGYIKNLNALIELIPQNEGPEFAEITRRLGWEFNGVRLHELYFENISKTSQSFGPSTKLGQKIIESFGSFEIWQKNFKNTAAIRGIGWVILYYDKLSDRLFNVWINEHDQGHFAGCEPILVFDGFEHAYMLDYGIKKADYIEAFMGIIDWGKVEGRM